jgi:hypothetical protein
MVPEIKLMSPIEPGFGTEEGSSLLTVEEPCKQISVNTSAVPAHYPDVITYELRGIVYSTVQTRTGPAARVLRSA